MMDGKRPLEARLMVFRFGPARPMKVMYPLNLLSMPTIIFCIGALRSIDRICFLHAPPG